MCELNSREKALVSKSLTEKPGFLPITLPYGLKRATLLATVKNTATRYWGTVRPASHDLILFLQQPWEGGTNSASIYMAKLRLRLVKSSAQSHTANMQESVFEPRQPDPYLCPPAILLSSRNRAEPPINKYCRQSPSHRSGFYFNHLEMYYHPMFQVENSKRREAKEPT